MNTGGGGGGGGGGGDYDTNVNNYSITELFDLIGLGNVSQIGENEFSHIINGFVEKYQNIDDNLSQFFVDVGQRLYDWLNTSLEVGRVGGDDDGSDGGDGGRHEGLAMRNTYPQRSGLEGGDIERGEAAEGSGYDDQMGGVGERATRRLKPRAIRRVDVGIGDALIDDSAEAAE